MSARWHHYAHRSSSSVRHKFVDRSKTVQQLRLKLRFQQHHVYMNLQMCIYTEKILVSLRRHSVAKLSAMGQPKQGQLSLPSLRGQQQSSNPCGRTSQWLNSLCVSQPSQLSLPSLRGRQKSSISCRHVSQWLNCPLWVSQNKANSAFHPFQVGKSSIPCGRVPQWLNCPLWVNE